MFKNKKDDTEEVKVITFNQSGFIMNLIFSIGVAAWMIYSIMKDGSHGVPYAVFGFLAFFGIFWCLGKLFGFCLRATGNYIIAAVVWFALLVGICLGIDKLFGDNGALIFLAILIIVPVLDFRKAIKFYKA